MFLQPDCECASGEPRHLNESKPMLAKAFGDAIDSLEADVASYPEHIRQESPPLPGPGNPDKTHQRIASRYAGGVLIAVP